MFMHMQGIVNVHGMSGSGKTTVASYIAESAAARDANGRHTVIYKAHVSAIKRHAADNTFFRVFLFDDLRMEDAIQLLTTARGIRGLVIIITEEPIDVADLPANTPVHYVGMRREVRLAAE